VPFDKLMMPAGNVEAWLGEVERRMKASIRTQVGAAPRAAAVAFAVLNKPV
jgi:dynein heavy chain